MEALLKKQLNTKRFNDCFWDNLIKVGENKITQPYLKLRLALLETYWLRFEDRHYNLAEYDYAAVEGYMKENAYMNTEDSYLAIKTQIISLLQEKASTSRHDSTSATASFLNKFIYRRLVTEDYLPSLFDQHEKISGPLPIARG